MRYFIEIAYDGTSYHGWQIQGEEPTVQRLLEEGLRYKLGCMQSITGCGRTDSGVHARQFFAHFDLDGNPDNQQVENAVSELNSFLPSDIAVYRIFRVADNAHARFDANTRTYHYYINICKDPFLERFAWTYRASLEVDAMNKAAMMLPEFSDFTSFAKLHSDAKTNICRISAASWSLEGRQLVFTITADRFLRNMVRAIVGTLIEVGRGKLTPEYFREVILSKDRGAAGMSAPAKGLFLQKVDYSPEKIFHYNEGLTD